MQRVIFGTMMNYIWVIMIVFSFVSAIVTDNMNNLSSAVLSSTSSAISLAIKLLGVLCFWNGLIQIAEKSGLTKKLCRFLYPVLKLLFPDLKDSEAREAIAMNMTANLLGLDNAATPIGLKAMKRLKEISSDGNVANNNMVRFVVINTASLHIVSTTVALLRQEYGSISPTEIIFPAILTSVIALSCGVLMTVILKKVFK